jgi:hypothetical protein
MRGWFLGYTVLIVGFSLTDPDFLGVIKDLRKVFKDDLPTLYALMRRPTEEQCRSWRTKAVQLIPYKEHRDLREFFAELLELSEVKYPSMTLVTHPLVFTKVKDIKAEAWAFYAQWKSEGSRSPKFGKIRVTVKGWRHVTRGSRPQAEVCHKLTLLPCAREIVEKAMDSVLVRKLDSGTDELGRAIERELHVVRGRHVQRFRADMRVDAVLEVTRLVKDQKTTCVKFYSVYERRA